MAKIGLFEQQARVLQQQLQAVEESIVDITSLGFALDELKNSKGKEIMAPVGRGIFIKANVVSEELLVDVGQRNFVKKNIEETKKIVEDQLVKLGSIKRDFYKKLEEMEKEMLRSLSEAQEEAEED